LQLTDRILDPKNMTFESISKYIKSQRIKGTIVAKIKEGFFIIVSKVTETLQKRESKKA